MNISLLICGGEESKRKEKAQELASENSRTEDIIIYEAEKNPGVGEIRKLVSQLAKKPYASKLLTAILVETQNLTVEAQGALLKTLEEPNEKTQLILTTPSEYSLLSTISSRCQKIYLKRAKESSSSVEKILKASPGERLEMAEKLDLDEWLNFFHEKLRLLILETGIHKESLANLVKYLRFATKLVASAKIANPKLIRYLAVLTVPKNTS